MQSNTLKELSQMTNGANYVIHWFRRDLRLHDNTALLHAIKSGFKVQCLFIFDRNILEELPEEDARVQFIHQQLTSIKKALQNHGSDLWVFHGTPSFIWHILAKSPGLHGVYTNRDYEPYAIGRDQQVEQILHQKDIGFHTFKDHVIFEKNEVVTQQDSPYKVYTPYQRAWKKLLQANLDHLNKNKLLRSYETSLDDYLIKTKNPKKLVGLKSLGFVPTKVRSLPTDLKNITVSDYDKVRDIPCKDGTSRLGTALRFGTMSIRKLVQIAMKENTTFLNELTWREFFSQILYHFPDIVHEPFRKKYAAIEWRNNEIEFRKWCEGKTGYPLVDAGMRELNATGFMHNRVRMVTASFLVKHLLVDWRWGEAYFAEKLMDYELASNNGNWQWVAGCGTDAAPYFRIFNPESQLKKFDPDYNYVKKWIEEWETDSYPDPVVIHKEARERCLKAYKAVV